jgi:hypothetical protein
MNARQLIPPAVRLTPRNTIYCSFCGRPHHEVPHMIVGPGDASRRSAICDACIDECTAKLAALRAEDAAELARQTAPTPETEP